MCTIHRHHHTSQTHLSSCIITEVIIFGYVDVHWCVLVAVVRTSCRMNKTAKEANSARDGAREMKFGADDGKYNDADFGELS